MGFVQLGSEAWNPVEPRTNLAEPCRTPQNLVEPLVSADSVLHSHPNHRESDLERLPEAARGTIGEPDFHHRSGSFLSRADLRACAACPGTDRFSECVAQHAYSRGACGSRQHAPRLRAAVDSPVSS